MAQSMLDVTTGKIKQTDQLVEINGKDVIFLNELTKLPEYKVTMQDGLVRTYVCQLNEWIPSNQPRQQIIETPQTFPEFATHDNITIQPNNCTIKLNNQEALSLDNKQLRVCCDQVKLDNKGTLQIEHNTQYGLGIKDISTGKSQFWMCPQQVYLYGKSIKGLQDATDQDSAVTLRQLQNAQCKSLNVNNVMDVSDKTYLNQPAEYQQRPELFEDKTLPDVKFVRDMFSQYTCNRRHGALDNSFQIQQNELISVNKLKYKNMPIIASDLDIVHRKYISDNFAVKQHKHPIDDVIDISMLANKQHNHQTSEITDIEQYYASKQHQHQIGDILDINLLADKQHSHQINEITDIGEYYAAKQHQHNLNDIVGINHKYALLSSADLLYININATILSPVWNILRQSDQPVSVDQNNLYVNGGYYQLQWKLLVDNNQQVPSLIKLSLLADNNILLPYHNVYCGSIMGEQIIEFSCYIQLEYLALITLQFDCVDPIDVSHCQLLVRSL